MLPTFGDVSALMVGGDKSIIAPNGSSSIGGSSRGIGDPRSDKKMVLSVFSDQPSNPWSVIESQAAGKSLPLTL